MAVKPKPANKTKKKVRIDPKDRLTDRDRAIVHLLHDGLSNYEIADELKINRKTVAKRLKLPQVQAYGHLYSERRAAKILEKQAEASATKEVITLQALEENLMEVVTDKKPHFTRGHQDRVAAIKVGFHLKGVSTEPEKDKAPSVAILNQHKAIMELHQQGGGEVWEPDWVKEVYGADSNARELPAASEEVPLGS
jgi:hypothetical protein